MNIIQLHQEVPPPNSSVHRDNDLAEINPEGIILVPYQTSFSYKKDKLVPSSFLDHLLSKPQDLLPNWKVNPEGYDFMRVIFRGTTFYYASLHIFYYYRCLLIDLKTGVLKKDCLQIGANSSEYGYVPVLKN